MVVEITATATEAVATEAAATAEAGVADSSPPTSAARSCLEKLRSLVTVEVVFFLYFFGMVSFYSCLQQYVFDRISQDNHFVKVSSFPCKQSVKNNIHGTPIHILRRTLSTLQIVVET